MNAALPIQCLVASHDDGANAVLSEVFRDLQIEAEVCAVPEQAIELLRHRKFEILIVDADSSGTLQVLQEQIQSPSNATAISYAIFSGVAAKEAAFKQGAKFALYRPLSVEAVKRSLFAGRGSILRERRRYFRHAVEAPVGFRAGERNFRGKLINISEDGIAVRWLTESTPAGEINVRFRLPQGGVVDAIAEVAWSDATGRAGLRFRNMEGNCRRELQEWLTQKMETQNLGPLFQ